MEILQIILISLIVYLGSIGTPWFFGTTGGFYTLGRPLIAAAIVGFILGDMETALAVGVIIQAMYIGIITPGAVMPFDVNYIGYLTTALVVMSNASPELGVTIAVPVGLLGVLIWNIIWVINVYFAHRADRYAEKGSSKGVRMMNVLPQIVNFVLRFVPAFFILFLGRGFLEQVLALIPETVEHYLIVVGGILPALGIGLLLTMIIKDKMYLGVFLLGFLMVVYLELPIIAISIFGIIIAMFAYRLSGKDDEDEVFTQEEQAQPLEGFENRLTNRLLFKTWLTWFFFNGSSQSGERMQGIAFAHSMSRIIDQLYHTKEQRIAAYKRHLTLFNVEPQVGSVVVGVTAAMEEQKAAGAELDDESINTVKVGLMGPLSGIGDTIIVGTMIPILLALAIGITEAAGVAGPIFYLVIYPTVTFIYSWFLFKYGYNAGLTGIQSVISSGQLHRLTTSLNILGLLVMGALSATYIQLTTPLTYTSGEMELALQSILDQILPGLLPLLTVGLVYYLLDKKKKSALWVMGFLFIYALVGVLIKLF